MSKILNYLIVCIAFVSFFETRAQQSSIVLSDLHADLGFMYGETNFTNSNQLLLAEIKVNNIESVSTLEVTFKLRDSTSTSYHFTVIKNNDVYVIRDMNGKQTVFENGKIQISTKMDIDRNKIKTIEFYAVGNNGNRSNTLIKQF